MMIRLKFLIPLLTLAAAYPIATMAADEQMIVPEWQTMFANHSVRGTLLVLNRNQRKLYVHNSARAGISLLPASTFKIPNTLIALETGIIADEFEVIQWDGVERSRPVSNRDHNLESAFANSVVWVYQDLARKIGVRRMSDYLQVLKYGNGDIGSALDTFWLEGPLLISAEQQIDFLTRLQAGSLPFRPEVLATLKRIMIVEQTDAWVLRAKTGWALRPTRQIGWYVGYLEGSGQTWIFALNIDIVQPEDARARALIVKQALLGLGAMD